MEKTKQERIESLRREIKNGHSDAAMARKCATEVQRGYSQMTQEQWASEADRFERRAKALEGMLAQLEAEAE